MVRTVRGRERPAAAAGPPAKALGETRKAGSLRRLSCPLSHASRLGYSLYLQGMDFLYSVSNVEVPMRSCGAARTTLLPG